jgi:juvenile hormone epoxide hydrolase
MGIITKLLLLVVPIGIAALYFQATKPDPIPIVEDEFWGPKSEQGKKEDTSIRQFKIDIPAAVIDDLKTRLKTELNSNRLVDPLEGIGFEYGFNSKFLKTVGQHWLNKYDWRAREKLLNKYPQFKTKIGGLDIHFYHVKPSAKAGVKTRPVLLLHGWPGSIVEFQKIIPLLSEPKNSKYNYELIIPSLPGYGFSSGAARPGFGTVEMANIFKRLMERLGHKKFIAMGGDWGALITSDLATLYPDRIIGAHASMCPSMSGLGHFKSFLAATFPAMFAPPELAKHILPWGTMFSFIIRETGYMHLQGTKPETVGAALSHSPLGLAAYILEKFSTWTNREWINREDGGILENFTMDELLDNVMVYWVTGSITTSMRLYSEALLPTRKHILDKVPTNVPYDCQQLPGDLVFSPEFVIRDKFTNLKKFSLAPKGGHFGAFEVPDIVADDAVSFFNSL